MNGTSQLTSYPFPVLRTQTIRNPPPPPILRRVSLSASTNITLPWPNWVIKYWLIKSTTHILWPLGSLSTSRTLTLHIDNHHQYPHTIFNRSSHQKCHNLWFSIWFLLEYCWYHSTFFFLFTATLWSCTLAEEKRDVYNAYTIHHTKQNHKKK